MPAHLLFQLPDGRLIRRPQTFREVAEQARNAEEALLAALNATILPSIGMPGFEPVDIRPSKSDRALIGSLIHRLRGQRTGPHVLSLKLFAGLSLSGEALYFQDLYGMDAQGADFSDASLVASVLEFGDFSGCDFRRANVAGIRVDNAQMTGADFTEAVLRDVDVKRLRDAGAIVPNSPEQKRESKRRPKK
ncbi:pentapeptide repeat-containing protein [Bradyrhizobium ontarionense]|uniref:Pentapeptide repeat-containing protein n=1 Tax=Bradyrhizobium ontarionense TaxID=2898149 RepID=A0ABY3RB49_9BRAD|nr:pentapeptide repeat-containing protein [Bradyrhizobium sp. A19]UFZ04031.1 pentapeptide repeat-containing protein [Bradyrhizobium sp. A19]